MSHIDIIRAWKDEDYRNSLSEAERALLPENPAGLIELGDADMESVAGGVEPALMKPTLFKCLSARGCGGTLGFKCKPYTKLESET